jgi:SAM-dependent methyltransferase
MNQSFYRDFEDRFRGSREDIKQRLEQYVPFLEPLLTYYPKGRAVDLGCGRGEWLELTQGLGFNSHGVDLDEGMLAACEQRGLKVVKGQALDYLSALEDESQIVVSGFHVIEHISFEELRQWVSEAFRVLKPGGLLIFETPNPENVAVANIYFYLDPTHLRPIPPALLSFVYENTGFETVKTLRLQHPKEFSQGDVIGLSDVIFSVSPDYAVIGQKNGPEELIRSCSIPFEADYGVSLDMLIDSWDSQLTLIRTKATNAQLAAEQSESKATNAQLAAEQAWDLARYSVLTIENLRNSRSWRITAPFRWLGSQFRKVKSFVFRSRSD